MKVMAITSDRSKTGLDGDDWTNELTSAGLPNPRTADVRDPPGRTVPAGFPPPPVGGCNRHHVDSILRYAASFARPYDAEAVASHRSSERTPERSLLWPVREGPPHHARGRPGLVHQRR